MHAVHKAFIMHNIQAASSESAVSPKGAEIFLHTASNDKTLSDAAAFACHSALSRAIKMMVGDHRAVWAENIGRNVSHHSGWLALMHQFKMLKAHRGPRESALSLGQSGGKYQIIPYDQQVHPKLFASAHCTQLHLNTIRPPHTVSEWASVSGETFTKELETRGLSMPSFACDGYTTRWTLRAHMVAEMRVAGITSLDVGKVSLEEFSSLFPDQNKWIQVMAGKHTGVESFFREMDYKGPAELFSMYACLFGDEVVQRTPLQVMRKHVDQLCSIKEAYAACFGMSPHPAVLVRELAEHLPAVNTLGKGTTRPRRLRSLQGVKQHVLKRPAAQGRKGH